MSGLAIPDSKERSRRIDEELRRAGRGRGLRPRWRRVGATCCRTTAPAPGPGRPAQQPVVSLLARRPAEEEEPSRPLEVGGVWGQVTNVVDIGCFVRLQNVSARRREGLVHVSQLENRRVGHPSGVVAREDLVWVKVLSVDNDRNRISLSMKEVDQATGMPLAPDGGGGGRDWRGGGRPADAAGTGSNLTPLGAAEAAVCRACLGSNLPLRTESYSTRGGGSA